MRKLEERERKKRKYEYVKRWRAKNKDKIREYNERNIERYWTNRAIEHIKANRLKDVDVEDMARMMRKQYNHNYYIKNRYKKTR